MDHLINKIQTWQNQYLLILNFYEIKLKFE